MTRFPKGKRGKNDCPTHFRCEACRIDFRSAVLPNPGVGVLIEPGALGFRCWLLPGAFWSLHHQALFKGLSCNPDVTHLPIDERLDPLKIGQESALCNGRDMRADAALFLGFATAPNDTALHRAFAGQFTDSGHKQSTIQLRSVKSSHLVR